MSICWSTTKQAPPIHTPGFDLGETDAEGYQRFTNIDMIYGPSGLENCVQTGHVEQMGYAIKYLPVNVGTPTADYHYLQPATRTTRPRFGRSGHDR